jgi:hypothetical protein
MKNLALALPLILSFAAALAQPDSIKTYTTKMLAGAPPHIDGLGNDAAWDQVEWSVGDFRQVNPDKGKPASVQTKFKIIYDAKNIYALFRCYDPEPDKIVKHVTKGWL